MARPRRRVHLLFSAIAMVGVVYVPIQLWAYGAQNAPVYVEATRWALSLALVFFALFPFFVELFCEVRSTRFPTLIALGASLVLLVNVLAPYTVAFSTPGTLGEIRLPWGETIADLVAVPSLWLLAHAAVVLSVAFHALWTAVRRRRDAQARQVVSTLAAFALILSALIHDLIVDLTGLPWPYLGEYLLFILILLMSWRLSLDVREDGRRLRATNRALEAEVLERGRIQDSLRTLAEEASTAEERERRRIASNLHDRVGQRLILSKMRLARLRQSLGNPAAEETLDEFEQLLVATLNDTRDLTREISSPVLYELGLGPAVQWALGQMEENHGLKTSFRDDGAEKPLPEPIQVFLFRAVQELLLNVVKHASARRVDVTLRREDQNVEIAIWDDGKGLDLDAAPADGSRNGGFGLFHIRDRIDYYGGSFALASSPGKGVRATLRVPLASTARSQEP